MNKDSFSQAATYFNLSRNYFFVLRLESKPKFDYIVSLKDNITDSFACYKEEEFFIKSDMIDLYYKLLDERKLRDFGKLLVSEGIIVNSDSLGKMCSRTLFTNRTGFGKHETFIKFKKILELFPKYNTQ